MFAPRLSAVPMSRLPKGYSFTTRIVARRDCFYTLVLGRDPVAVVVITTRRYLIALIKALASTITKSSSSASSSLSLESSSLVLLLSVVVGL